MHYYDPKTDIVFKKIFGEHKNLTISLLNAVLKLEGDDQISDVEYLPSEIIPLTDGKRRSVVDVKCKVSDQIYFIVEMQMYWSADFLRRVMYNCSKLYATLYNEGVRYYKMKKIFAINILNDVYQTKNTNNYHRYTMSEVDNPESVIPGFEVVCIELPKFKPQDKAQGKMLRLWQSFLTSVNAGVDAESIPQELMENSETKQALELCQNLTEEERRAYDSFWDLESLNIDRENTVKEMGRAEGRAEGAKQKATETARQMKTDGLTVEVISKYTGLDPDEIAKL
ncbi:MAG: Rpn family recombination-promoting nuclease/putative transposase [Bacteroidales bacterium]|nr:Rpn family recombination-promoting nuclease/putative transposase [Bacteroidales bacterium]